MPSHFRFPNLITLNSVALTDESRSPLQETRDERSVIVELASGRKIKYIKGIFRKWSVTWDNVGMDSSQTVDTYGARNEIRAIAQLGTVVNLSLTDGTNTVENYSVFISSYQESIVMRRTNNYRYSITIEFEEQG